MFYIMNKYFKTAIEKANQINGIIREILGDTEKSFVPLEVVLEAVKKQSGYEIMFYRRPFSEILPKEKITKKNYGALLSTKVENDKKEAVVIVNSDFSPNMQRFSAVHELGHIITEIPNFRYETANDGKSTLSTHINPDITFLDEKEYKDNKYLLAEQVANIFALMVLIPKDLRIRDLSSVGLDVLAKRYGVTTDAIFSRVLLTNLKFVEE